MGIQEVSNLFLIGSAFLCLCFLLHLQHLAVFLTMEAAQCAIGLQNLQRLADIAHVHRREQVTIRTGKALECRYAAVMQVNQVIHVVLDRTRLVVIIAYDAAPQCIIHQGMLADLAIFQVKDLLVHQGRIIVQRHVNQGCAACNNRCPGTGFKILAVFKARFVQMCVAVDDAREYILSSGINHLFCFHFRALCYDCCIFAILDGNIRLVDPVRRDKLTVFHQQIIHNYSSILFSLCLSIS